MTVAGETRCCPCGSMRCLAAPIVARRSGHRPPRLLPSAPISQSGDRACLNSVCGRVSRCSPRNPATVRAMAELQFRLTQQSVRPPRAVTLVRSDDAWHIDMLRMMECYSRTWGGDGNGLAACSGSWEMAEPFWRLLGALDPDHWDFFQRTRRGLQLSDPGAYDALLAADIGRYVEHGWAEADAREFLESDDYLSRGNPAASPTALDERIRRWFAPLSSPHMALHGTYTADQPPPQGLVDMCQLTYQPEQTTVLDASSYPLGVQLLISASTGAIAPGHRERLEQNGGWTLRTVPVGDHNLSAALELAWAGHVDSLYQPAATGAGQGDLAVPGFLGETPLAQCRLGCSWMTKLRPGLENEPVVVICGDTAEDFCYAFTRQRVVGNTYWLPMGPGYPDQELGGVLQETLARVLHGRYRRPAGNRAILMSSLTMTPDDLSVMIALLQQTIWGGLFTSDPTGGGLNVSVCVPADLAVRRDLALLDQEHFADIRHEPFSGAEHATTLQIPQPSVAQGRSPDSYRWQVDVMVPDHVLPARWCLDTLISDQQFHWAARSSTAGTSVDSHGRVLQFGGSPLSQLLVQVKLRFPPAPEVFAALLGDAGRLRESDKGRYSRRMIELWGSFGSLAADLQARPTRHLLGSWASDKVTGDLGRIHQGRKYLRLQDVMRITGLHIEQARDLLDSYLTRGIITRGLVLKCALCAGTAFYRLEDLGPGFSCQRCRQANQITIRAWSGPREPQWFYALDEVVVQGLRANAQVPMLALAQLKAQSRSFLYMPEAVVIMPGRPDLEVDLWAIINGQIVIGEAKKSDLLEKTDRNEKSRCRALRALAEAITADKFVMATASSEWRTRTRNNVSVLIDSTVPVQWIHDLDEFAP
jgi:hypothetical protein